MLAGYRDCLRDDDVTVADVLRRAGHATGLFGKWGLAVCDQPGLPTRKGFDEFFYWEFLGSEGVEQAVRMGNWRAYRPHADAPTELYDIAADTMERRDIAAERQDLVAAVEELFRGEHAPSAYFPSPGESLADWSARAEALGIELPENVDLF
jgi:arylsulfatase A-like enzyme